MELFSEILCQTWRRSRSQLNCISPKRANDFRCAQGDDLRTFLAELVSNAASCLEALNHTEFPSLVSAGSTTEAFHKKEDVEELAKPYKNADAESLFGAESDQGIDGCGAEGGDVAGQQGDGGED